MVSPLTDAAAAALNSATPSSTPFVTPYSSARHMDYEVTSFTTQTITDTDSDGPPSSPFAADVTNLSNSENISPSKTPRPVAQSSVEREQTSPLKPLKIRSSPEPKPASPQKSSEPTRSPRKLSSPEKRFPVRPSISPEKRPVVVERKMSLEDALRDNEGLTKAIEILEDEDSELHEDFDDEANDTLTSIGRAGSDEAPNMDDTMVSTFSTFSAVPDMTMFAKIGHSPTKPAGMTPSPRRTQMSTPATSRRTMNHSPSPTPRGNKYDQNKDDGNTTNLILDFTEQISGFSGRYLSPAKQARLSPTKSSTTPDLFGSITPSVNRHMSNLLDFDIPPAPTPRSLPTITPRELESLKSSFLSEISSLKASLSGKEAEVQSLKTAVGDAEKRVGECMEQLREERDLKEQLAAEREGWEKRGKEMESVLRNVKEEILHGERERDNLEGRLEESERRREAAEMMAQEAESKMAAMRSGKISPTPEAVENKPGGDCSCGGRTVELAVEKVSRELHSLYKDKHETKVAALKKSYERRWDKKVKELEERVEELTKENEELKLGRDTTMTKVEPKNPLEVTEELEKQAARDARTKELEAELEGLSEIVKSVKRDNDELRELLDSERVEKGKLVQAVDEMIPLVAAFDDMLAEMNSAPATATQPSKAPGPQSSQPNTIENLRGSISRASGLRAPTNISSIAPGESRIGRGGFGAPAGSAHERSRSGSSQGTRPGSGLGYRSGIMSSIEKMGNHRGRGE